MHSADSTSTEGAVSTLNHPLVTKPIVAHVLDDRALLWDHEAVFYLRTQYRLVGAATGELPESDKESIKGLPVLLFAEQITLAVQRGWISRLVDSRPRGPVDTITAGGIPPKMQKLIPFSPIEDQPAAAAAPPTAQPAVPLTLQKLDPIQRRQLLAQIEKLQQAGSRVYISTRTEYSPETLPAAEWRYPSTPEEELRYRVFVDLWERGFYLSSAAKFGGHYLAYIGDPERVHAQYIITVVPWNERLPALSIVAMGRLGVAVKKIRVLASVHPATRAVTYFSVDWQGVT